MNIGCRSKHIILVLLPYPDGVDAEHYADYSFTLAHMFASTYNGNIAGEMEFPAITLEADGIHFHINSLSPILLTWKKDNALVSVSADSATVDLADEMTGSCIVAIYDENGKMLTVGTKAVTAETGEITVSYNRIVLPTHYTVKVFFVDNSNIPICDPVIKKFEKP